MPKKSILYISGSLGLGHITRDLAVAKELRRQEPEVEISWLAAHPATLLLEDAGEDILPEAEQYANDNIAAENAARGFRLNLFDYGFRAQIGCLNNIRVIKRAISNRHFDLVVGDEVYEIVGAMITKLVQIEAPFVMMYDFVGCDSITENPLEKLGAYLGNLMWAQSHRVFASGKNVALFVGQQQDVPDRSFGFLLPNRRDHARAHYKFTGYILPFDPAEYNDRTKVRAKLGYGKAPLVVCSIGGTAIGKDLLELCGQAYPIIKRKVPDLHMVLVCGPRLSVDDLKVPEPVEVRGYVPALYEHFAASDLAIVQGGGTATLELTALRRPFLYFPLANHCEQQIHVAGRLARHQAGVKMVYCQTTPEILAEKVIANIGKKVNYPPIPIDGAQKAAQLINQLL